MGAKSTGGARSKTFGYVTVRRKGMDRADGEGAATEVRGKPGEAGVPETRKRASVEGTVLNASCPQPFTEMMLRRQKCLLVFVLPKPAPLCVHLGLLITHALLHLWCGLAASPIPSQCPGHPWPLQSAARPILQKQCQTQHIQKWSGPMFSPEDPCLSVTLLPLGFFS